MAFEKGVSGNPAGRPPKKQSMTELLNDYGDQPADEKVTRKEALTAKVWELSLAGDLSAIKYIFDRIDGRPLVAQESQSESGGGLRIIISNEGDNLENVEFFLGPGSS